MYGQVLFTQERDFLIHSNAFVSKVGLPATSSGLRGYSAFQYMVASLPLAENFTAVSQNFYLQHSSSASPCAIYISVNRRKH